MMTEEEARKKWCPFSREGDKQHGFTFESRRSVVFGRLCLASDCMMWDGRNYATTDDDNGPVEMRGFCALGAKS